ncbi:DctP family TRAP transporter solute-binding subunit [Bacillus xiapuensis]|uniref:DctP family TRAP transporter solute-binding subunit n=1 Tax=Bacillus xiapuensis TaxID=2014075 RepID=UPI000C24ACE8|nr:DctP family TRAP transporter solute-binding subunit [Bacillus xiapuensis]
MKKVVSLLLLSAVFALAYPLLKDAFTSGGSLSYDDEQQTLDQKITLRFSHVVAENTPKGLAAQRFAELVHQKTEGRVQVELYQNGILYNDDTELEALKNGKVEMIAPSYSRLTDLVPAWKVLDLPFIFRDSAHAQSVLTGSMRDPLLQMLDEKGIRGLAFWSNGFKQMTSRYKLLMKPEDFKGLTFRTMPGEVIANQFQLLQAQTVVTPFNEVYRSLASRRIDGQENTVSNIYSKRLYQVQKSLTITNHGYLGYVVIVNEKFWEGLPKDLRSLILEALQETTAWNMNTAKNMNERQLNDIRRRSPITIHELTEREKQEWQRRFTPLYRKIEHEVGGKWIDRIKHQR